MPQRCVHNVLLPNSSSNSATVVKKAPTLKSLCLTNRKKRILYISKCYAGNHHDYKLLQDCFAPSVDWFKQKTIYGWIQAFRALRISIHVKSCISLTRRSG